jgi:hypothetical protein
MTRDEARKFARECLANYREDCARLAQKREILETLHSGSDKASYERNGNAHFRDNIPWWLDAKEEVLRQIRLLELRVRPIERLLEDAPRNVRVA